MRALFLLLCISSTAYCQNRSLDSIKRINQSYRDLYFKSDQLLKDSVGFSLDISKTMELVTIDIFSSLLFGDEIELSQAALKASNKGIGFTFGYRQNIGNSLEEDFGLSQNRMTGGVYMNLLDQGLIGNRRDAKILQAKSRWLKADASFREQSQQYPFLFNYVHYAFNERKIDLLRRYINYLKQKKEIIRNLCDRKEWPRIKLKKIETEISEKEQYLLSAQNFNRSFSTLFTLDPSWPRWNQLAPIPLSLNEILTAYDQLSGQSSIQKAQEEYYRQLYNRTHIPSVKVYANYNMINVGAATGSRRYISTGVQLNYALKGGKRIQHQIRDLRLQEVQQEYNLLTFNKKKELLNLYYEYSYQYKQYERLRRKQLEETEHIRVGEKLFDYYPQTASIERILTPLERKVLLELEKMDLVKQMYQNLLKINNVVPLTSNLFALKI